MLMSAKTPIYMDAHIYVTIPWEVMLVFAQRVTTVMEERMEVVAKEKRQMYINSGSILVCSHF